MSAGRMGAEIEVRSLGFAYPDGTRALESIDLLVHRGERVALLGPNGAGKTTLVLHLNGVLTPGVGRVSIGGLEVAKENLREIRRRVGIVFQDPLDQLFMPTVAEDVAFGPANLGVEGDDLEHTVARALEQVGLSQHAARPPHHLSFGQRRRASLATVLAMSPMVLVLDEPTANLDPAGRRELAGILRSLDTTMIMVTHDLSYALELCPRAVVMNEGRVVDDGSTYEILSDEQFMKENGLDLPYGFHPTNAARAD